MMMTAGARKLALTTHITSSVGWLGSVAAFLALAIAGVTSDDSQIVRALKRTMQVMNQHNKAFYRWTRDLHLYLGLFVSPFLIAFAVSVFFLNHAKVDTSVAASITTFRDVTIPAGIENARGREAVARASEIVSQVGVTGEIGFVRYSARDQRIVVPVSKPGLETIVDVDIPQRTAIVSRRPTGVLESVAYLHKMPGPHNADLRGNWFLTRAWRWVADGTVYLLLFISATGLYLWFSIKAERRMGLALLGAGALTFFTFMYALAL